MDPGAETLAADHLDRGTEVGVARKREIERRVRAEVVDGRRRQILGYGRVARKHGAVGDDAGIGGNERGFTRVDPDPVDFHRGREERVRVRIPGKIAADCNVEENVERLVERRRERRSRRGPGILHGVQRVFEIPANLLLVPLYGIGVEIPGHVDRRHVLFRAEFLIGCLAAVIDRAKDRVAATGRIGIIPAGNAAQVDGLDDVDFAGRGPASVGTVLRQHPEGRPDSLPCR